MNLNNFVKAAIFTATAIALGFVFMLIPNVEFISVSDANHFFSNSEKDLKKVLNKYIKKESALY